MLLPLDKFNKYAGECKKKRIFEWLRANSSGGFFR